jgi:hypothetical protein
MKRRIAALTTTLLWALFTYLGYDAMQGVARQHAPGYPNAGQWHYYVYFPIIMLFFGVALFLMARRLPSMLFRTLWGAQVVVFIVFFLGSGGGM